MLRGLYRFYLYVVFIVMLFLAASGLRVILQVLLAYTSLRGTDELLPTHTDVVQAAVFAVVAGVIAALVGGLHYWLIRRDIRGDPGAGSGGIRAFFLNFVEATNLPFAVGFGIFVIVVLGQQFASNTSTTAAFVITTLGLVALLEWERRRSQAGPGAAITFQRLHFYGVQLVLLFILTPTWLFTVGQLVDSLLFSGKGSGVAPCGGFTTCNPGPNLLSLVTSTLWVILFWAGYSLLTRGDTASLLRRVLHFIGFAYGMYFLLLGIGHAIEVGLLALFKVPADLSEITRPFAEYEIAANLTLGLLVVGVYVLWLRNAARQQPKEQTTMLLTAEAITATLMGASFWVGWVFVLLNALERIAPSNTPLNPGDWATAFAFVITGLGYIPLGLHLRWRSARTASIAPLRGFAFALLGLGTLVGAIGGVVALYAYGTALLGSPFDNWQYTAHAGTAAFVVGAIIVGLYLWTSIQARLFSGPSKRPVPAEVPLATIPETPAAEVPSTIEPIATPAEASPVTAPTSIAEVLDELLAGRITRDEAVTRIDTLVKQGS